MERFLNYFKPSHYDLKLQINKQTELIKGQVQITGQPLTQQIKLHAKDLVISSAKINNLTVDFTQQKDAVVFDHLETQDSIKITLDFSCKLSHNMIGAYLSTYLHEGHEERIVATQFESHYARQCFPCVDEPAAKATFTLAISSSDADDTVISNMPAKTKDGDFVVFETTPRMSTYLLAFCLGKFQSKTTTNSHGTKITTYCALNQSPSLLDFPNQLAADTLVYYEDLFDTPYPLPKLDQVALPDFDAGAMENWGLVTYRESCLLADDSTSIDSRESISTVITHELAHQWFGNLVTMQWWDDLWLNESFASVIEYFAVDALHPEYNIWQNFFTGDCLAALRRDALPGVQSVRQPVHHPDEINTLFDGAIVYAKGAHLMFMLIRLIGQAKFFQGIKNYFAKHQYQNTTGDDLWEALQPFADFEVKTFMDAWLSQPGYPVLTKNHQQRFLLDNSHDASIWPLPKIQDDMSGHYLINLDDAEFASKLQDFPNLSLEQKLRLLIDRQLLAITDLVSSVSLIDLVLSFQSETSQPIWDILLSIAASLKIFFSPQTESFQSYQKFLCQLIATQIKRLGLVAQPKESANDTKLRPMLLATAVLSNESNLIKALANLYRDDFTKINADVRPSILLAKLADSNEGILPKLITAYQKAADQDLKADLLTCITRVKKPQNITSVIDLLKQPKIVRHQDHLAFLAHLLSNPFTKASAEDWVYANWDYILEITNTKSTDYYIRVMANNVRTPAEAKRFFDFFDPLSDQPALSRAIQIAHFDIAARLDLIKTDAPAVVKRLSQYS